MKCASRRHLFNLMEVIVAAVLLGLLFTGVYSGMHLNEEMRDREIRKQQALQVLDNVIEQLRAAERTIKADEVQHILAAEFQASQLAEWQGAEARCIQTDDKLLLTIYGQKGRTLAQLEVPTAMHMDSEGAETLNSRPERASVGSPGSADPESKTAPQAGSLRHY